MAKVSKDMLVDLCCNTPSSIRDLSAVGILLFGPKFTLMLYDLPAGYVCRVNALPSIYLPEDAEDINGKLLDMLIVTYKARLVMESNNKIIKQSRTPLDFGYHSNNNEVILPSFNSEDNKQKRRRTETTTTSNE